MFRLSLTTRIGALIATKVDQAHRRVISQEQGRQFASQRGLHYFECSSVSLLHDAGMRALNHAVLRRIVSLWKRLFIF
jgi:hypothetical protein